MGDISALWFDGKPAVILPHLSACLLHLCDPWKASLSPLMVKQTLILRATWPKSLWFGLPSQLWDASCWFDWSKTNQSFISSRVPRSCPTLILNL